jgi:hypothetical protein
MSALALDTESKEALRTEYTLFGGVESLYSSHRMKGLTEKFRTLFGR